MKRLFGVAGWAFLSVFLISSADAAPENASGNAQVHQGETDGKKAMKLMREREKKRSEIKKRAAAERQKQMSKNSGNKVKQNVK